MTYSAQAGSKLERSLRRIDDDLKALKRKVGANEKQAETGRQELRTAQDRLRDEVTSAMADVDARVRAVEEAVTWLEDRLLADGNITPADLDATDDTLRRLTEQARRGRHAEARLLDAATRRRLQEAIDTADRLAGQIAGRDRAALRWSTALAETEPGTEQHHAALVAYRSTADALSAGRAALPAARELAADARRALNTDATQRHLHSAQVAAGQDAARQVREVLRDRLARAVAEVARLPDWLRFVLGRRPSADLGQWMDTATSLLAYRVTYGVTDPAVALGRHRHDDPRRQAWHDDLEARLRAHRRPGGAT
ncbi:MAG: hypothetical protein ABW022_27660 [Actinoplanes sp.]